ncbi:unnamed protein product [Strongylus vulgaris]|uniref:Uncharacterized protein n=1 Tax=Strongylus vulgaris TaxID=40348 RepID=A0A3P7J1Z5_STRVU|nr:unnamed protein product [Strongylus vulgaris]
MDLVASSLLYPKTPHWNLKSSKAFEWVQNVENTRSLQAEQIFANISLKPSFYSFPPAWFQVICLLPLITIIPDSIGSYDAEEHNEEWQSMLQFDCRGLEPFDFEPRNGWTAVGIESGTAWADYDEKAGEATEISDIEVRFVHAKTKK